MPYQFLLKNFEAADRKGLLARFRTFANNQDVEWIDDAPRPRATYVFTSATIVGSTATVDISQTEQSTILLLSDVTLTVLRNGRSSYLPIGSKIYLRVVQDSVGGHAFAFPAELWVPQNFTVNQEPNAVTMLPLVRSSTSSWEFEFAPFSFIGVPYIPTPSAVFYGFDTFNGGLTGAVDGINTTYSMPITPTSLMVFVGGMEQQQGLDFTWAGGTTVVFSVAPFVGAIVSVVAFVP